MKKSIAVLLVVSLLLALIGCSATKETTDAKPQEEVTQSDVEATDAESAAESVADEASEDASSSDAGSDALKNGELIRVSVKDLPTDWSPWCANTVGRNYVLCEIYQPLAQRDKETGELICVLAESIEKTDGYTYRITLRQGVKDSAGNEFKASDAKFSYDKCIEFGNMTGVKYIDSVTVVSDYVLDLKLTIDNDYTISSAISPIWMVTEASYNASEDGMQTTPVGTGAYTLENFVSGTSVALTAVDGYWGAALAEEDISGWFWFAQNFDRIEYTMITEESQASIALETGLVDVVQATSSSEAERFLSSADYSVDYFPDPQTYILYFSDTAGTVCNNQKLRQAICYAIDAAGIAKSLGGYSDLCTTNAAYWYSDCVDSWAEEDYYSYNLEKAAELVNESGYDGTTIRLMTVNYAERVAAAQVIMNYMMAAGLNVEILDYDHATFTTYSHDTSYWDMKLDLTAGECCADVYTNNLGYTGRSNDVNFQGVHDETLEELIKGCSTTENHTDENIDACHQYIKEQAYAYGLCVSFDFNLAVNAIDEIPLDSRLVLVPGGITVH